MELMVNNSNQTVEDLFSCYSPSVVGYRYFAVLWGCAVTFSGTVGNLMTVLAFASDSRLQTKFNVLIVNLAVADLLYCTVLQPITVDSYLHLQWRSGQLWCQIFGLLLFLSNSVSIITLCLIAMSRYLMVAKRTVFNRVFSTPGLILLLISAWALGLASFGPLWSVYVFVPEVCTCSFHRIKGRPYTTILLFFYFIIGLGCVGVFYYLVYKQVRNASRALLQYRLSRRSSRRKPPPSDQGTDDSGVESGVGKTCTAEISSQMESDQHTDEISQGSSLFPPQSSHTPLKSSSNKMEIKAPPSATAAPTAQSASSGDDEFKRVTRMCFAVFLCFVCCFVPFMILNIADKKNQAPQVLHMFCANLTWLNSCINPVLYAVMNRQFKQAYSDLLSKAVAPFSCLYNQWLPRKS